MMYLCVLVLSLIGVSHSATTGHAWAYKGSHGVNHWSEDYSLCSSDSPRQSPIDIVTDESMYEHDLDPISLRSDSDTKFTIKNNGHTVVAVLDGSISVEGGGLQNKYVTHSFHFHWGSLDDSGSEHTVNGRSFPLEMHIVNYDASTYSSLGEAAPQTDGLAVLGVFFEVSGEENVYLQPLLDAMMAVKDPSADSEQISGLSLNELLPINTAAFYRYLGSLTTPPCYESVVWTVFNTTNTLSLGQLDAFRQVLTSSDESPVALQDNYRPTQLLHGRQVLRSFHQDEPETEDTIVHSPEVEHHEEEAKNKTTTDEGISEPVDGEPVTEHHGENEEGGHGENDGHDDGETDGHGDKEPAHKHVHHWGYSGEGGPSHWHVQYAACDSNNPRQSPVDITVTETEAGGEELDDVDFVSNIKEEDKITFTNNGHTVVGILNGEMTMIGAGLGGVYRTHSFHFHWGSSNEVGSEHTVDGKAFPLEMHIVHYDSERAENLGKALSVENGLAVLGVLFTVGSENNTAMEPIIEALRAVRQPKGGVHEIDHVDLKKLLPMGTEHYYRYEGSLTTPPCSPAVVWTVLANPQTVSEAQMEEFRQILTNGDDTMTVKPLLDNYRPVQPLHKRKVLKSFALTPKVIVPKEKQAQPAYDTVRTEDGSGSQMVTVSSTLCVLSASLAVMLTSLVRH